MQTAAQPAVNSDEILKHLPRIDGVIPMYAGGEWKLASDGGTREIVNPSNGRDDRDDCGSVRPRYAGSHLGGA